MSTGSFEKSLGAVAVVQTGSIGNLIVCVPPLLVCSFFILLFWFRIFFSLILLNVFSGNTVASTANQRALRWSRYDTVGLGSGYKGRVRIKI